MGLSAVPLEKLEKVRVREAWPEEAQDFTPWLATEGIEILSGELGVDLKVVRREHAVGRYSLDILAAETREDGSEDPDRPQYWIESPLGESGYYLSFIANRRDRWIGCELDIRPADPTAKLQALQLQQEVIEAEIGRGLLDWLEVSSKFFKVELALRNNDPSDRSKWEEQHQTLFSIGESFHRTFAPRVRAL